MPGSGMATHEGHRQRLRDHFLKYGLGNFDDVNIIELLLCYALPRKDTNAIARMLLDHFGSLAGVFDATEAELTNIPGVGAGAAALIRMIPEISRRYMMAKTEPGVILSTSEAAGRYLMPRFVGQRDETVMMVCLDAKLKVLGCATLGSGGVATVQISIRQVVQTALAQNAAAVILSHNHTSGIALPSAEDKATTHMVQEALAMVGVTLADHIIAAGDDFVSMADSGLLKKI